MRKEFIQSGQKNQLIFAKTPIFQKKKLAIGKNPPF